jgi:2'-5' RNA ligase
MEAGPNNFAIALTFSEKIEKAVNKLRVKYHPNMTDPIVPHLTLVYPFTPVFSLFQINERLNEVARRTSPFSIILHGIKFFENGNNVAYVAIQNRDIVKDLHTDIVTSLDGFIKEWRTDGKFNLDMFIPHVTILSRIPEKLFPAVKRRFSRYHWHFQDDVTGFSLFSERNGQWERHFAYELKGTISRGDESSRPEIINSSSTFHEITGI